MSCTTRVMIRVPRSSRIWRRRGCRSLATAVLCAGFLTGRLAQAQLIVVPQPSAAEVAAGQRKLRHQETYYAGRLRRSHGDPSVGAAFGEALRGIEEIRLDHPSGPMRDAIARAADPYALALAIVDDASWGGAPATYEIDVLIAAEERAAGTEQRVTLWAKAAALESQDRALSLAFLSQAYAVLGAAAADAAAGDCGFDMNTRVGALPTPAVCMVAGERIQEMLDAGLAHEAVTTFDALPAKLRERLLAAWGEPADLRSDRRLALAAARLLDGDPDGARALLGRVATAAWRAADPRPAQGHESDPSAVLRAVLERLLAAPQSDDPLADPFPLLAEFVAADLFGLDQQVSGVSTAAFARLADRESYPEFGRYAWSIAQSEAGTAADAPAYLPPEVLATAGRLRGELAAAARTFADAAQAAQSAAPRWPEVQCQVDCDRLDRAEFVKLLAMDRSGEHGVAILESVPAFGELFRIELRNGRLIALRDILWQS